MKCNGCKREMLEITRPFDKTDCHRRYKCSNNNCRQNGLNIIVTDFELRMKLNYYDKMQPTHIDL
jgi:hypothetical protein